MKKIIFTVFAIVLAAMPLWAQRSFTLKSPDGKLSAEISAGKVVEYSVTHDGDLVLAKSPVSMSLDGGKPFGVNSRLTGRFTRSVDEKIPAAVYKRNTVENKFNELTLTFREHFNIIFRAYDDGIAYRFVSNSRRPLTVVDEQAVFNFPQDYKAFVPYVRQHVETLESQMFNSFENLYTHTELSKWDKKRLAFCPLLVEGPNGKKVCITEADLMNYPGMFLYNGKGDASISGVFARYPQEVELGGHNKLQGIVKTREQYIAKYTNGGVSFPWRVIIVSDNDFKLADSDMIYRLASAAPKNMDFSWVRPGKVAWEWWNGWNIYGVDFKTGVNNDTYKHYIDFASRNGIEYVILDEGWAVNLEADLMKVVPEIDLEELVAYGRERNVGLILWAGYNAFNRDMEGVCKHYSTMGVKGFKVDFMDRDDQPMVDFHLRAAQTAAKYHMMIDFHGTYKPTGLQRTYPNVVNFEGVFGLEQMKWFKGEDMVVNDVTLPFIRMVAGPMDYTQGAMHNAAKGNYSPIYSEPMSQGTRCRQLAEYVIFESPLNMLCDSPSNYEREPECLEFIASVPTVWDNTVALNGEVSKYITIARQKGGDWYVGSLTDWDARTLTLDLSFLGEGDFVAEVFRDGVNADRVGRDYIKESIAIPADRKLEISMAPGGGIAMKISRKTE